MSDRTFLDTNIFVYSFDQNEPEKAAVAKSLIQRSLLSGSGVISYQVVQEFCNVALRKTANFMSASECERYCIDTFMPLLAVQSSTNLFIRALHLYEAYSVSWYDSLILAAALELECDTLQSEDFQDGQAFGGLVVKNPFRGV
jgi:predicted nucleic acid-binding protein